MCYYVKWTNPTELNICVKYILYTTSLSHRKKIITPRCDKCLVQMWTNMQLISHPYTYKNTNFMLEYTIGKIYH